MDIRDVDRSDQAALRAFWEVGKAADNAVPPLDSVARPGRRPGSPT